ncbi:MAG: glucose PTS transporter subunit IIA [Lachnospiraceae bacterium]
MKDKVFGVLQRVGRSFMLPIAILPVAGLLLGIGSSFTNETMLETYGLTWIMGPGTILYAILEVMKEAGDIIFANLPILFALGVAIGMAKREKEVAALAATIAFFVMHASISAMITIHGGEDILLRGAVTSVCGISSLQMGVFGGIIVGLGVAALHNRFYKIEFPQVLSFFGGTRFVPIISALVYVGVGILMYYIWPVVQSVIYAVGDVVLRSGYAGTWVYGFMERLLIPFGLHHVFYLPFWQTALGGTMEIQGAVVEGAQNIYFAQLADPTVQQFSVSATRFMSGKFPLMIFGLPGAALAMYKTARPEKRKEAGGLLLSAALTSMLTGITEPLEFTFIFVAPLLYGIHCVMAGFAFMLMHVFNVGVGMTFSGGFIDLFLFGILQGNGKTHWIWIIVVGIVYFIVYYLLFRFLIMKLNLKTPGREDAEGVKLYHRSDVEARRQEDSTAGQEMVDDNLSQVICRGLGGKHNISDVDCCATRLRCTVHKAEFVDDALLRSTGASGVVHKGNGVQIIYGPRVTVIKSNLEAYLETAPDTELIVISSPVTGTAAELATAPDEAFAEKMMGDGVVVTPEEAVVRAPEDGMITMIFDTKHAMGFQTNTGVSLLFHMGIDTVQLQGKGFRILVEKGQKVKKGVPLMELDLDYLKEHATSLVSPIVCTDLEEGQSIRLLATGRVKAGNPLFVIEEDVNR